MMKKYKRIVLIGFRGVGKTTIGKMLAQQLNWTYVSTDEMVEKRSHNSIADMVRKSGWKEFRDIEHEVLRSVSEQTDAIIDCGGGVVEDPLNMESFNSESLIIWIDADLADIMNRISGDQNLRPLLSQNDLQSDTEKNYTERRPRYQRYADFHFNSSENIPEEICRFILKEITGGN